MSRHHRAMSGRRWQRLRMRIFARDRWRCRVCGRAARLDCDHIEPVDRGGDRWDPANLQSLCRSCHIDKTRRERGGPEIPGHAEWRRFVDELVDT